MLLEPSTGVEQRQVGVIGRVADVHHRLQLLAGQPRHAPAVAQRRDEDARALGVEALHQLALHVGFAGVAQHIGQRRLPREALDRGRPARDRLDHEAQTGRRLGGRQPPDQGVVQRVSRRRRRVRS